MVRITIKNLQKKISLHQKKIKRAALNTLSLEGIKKSGEITFCFVNDKRIRKINLNYLSRNNPTDVMVFDISEPKISDNIFADIVISTDRALANARIYKTPPLYELYLYVIHGMLHLLGYDDRNTRQRRAMDARANRILSTLKLYK